MRPLIFSAIFCFFLPAGSGNSAIRSSVRPTKADSVAFIIASVERIPQDRDMRKADRMAIAIAFARIDSLESLIK